MSDVFSAIRALLLSGTGLGVEFGDILSLHQLENGRYRIFLRVDWPDEREWIYDDATKAVTEFMKLRSEHHIGFDFEKGA